MKMFIIITLLMFSSIFAQEFGTGNNMTVDTLSAYLVESFVNPGFDATTNTTNVNAFLSGGGKTLHITKAGTYEFNNTIYVYSNSKIICEPGVYIKKVASYGFTIANAGLVNVTTDSNIVLSGINILVNGKEVLLDDTAQAYGMRGQISMYRCKNVYIDNVIINDLGSAQWGIQACSFQNLNISKCVFRGLKDGIHLGAGDGFVIRDIVTGTYDDALALNAQDYPSCNPVLGDIKNGLVENWTDLNEQTATGYTVRNLVGRWVDWGSGKMVQMGDAFNAGGRIYRVVNGDATQVATLTQPTHTSGCVTDAQGIRWRYIMTDTIHSANVLNVTFKNITSRKDRTMFGMVVDVASASNRSVHPTVDTLNYPAVYNINIDGLYSEVANRTTHFIAQSKWVRYKVDVNSFSSLPASTQLLIWNGDISDSSQVTFTNCNFRGHTGSYNFSIGGSVKARFVNNFYNDSIRVTWMTNGKNKPSVYSTDRITSISNLAPKAGDMVNYYGIMHRWNGSTWEYLIGQSSTAFSLYNTNMKLDFGGGYANVIEKGSGNLGFSTLTSYQRPDWLTANPAVRAYFANGSSTTNDSSYGALVFMPGISRGILNVKGSAYLPSYAFYQGIANNDSTFKHTGMWYDSANVAIGFSVNGTNKVSINTSGNVGINNSTPNAKAKLDIVSTTQGVLLPRMTTTEKNAISSPPEGLIVYDLTLHKLCVYNGSEWQTITSAP